MPVMSPSFDVLPVTAADRWLVRDTQSIIGACVDAGAGLGWLTPPSYDEIEAIVHSCAEGRANGEAAMVVGILDSAQVGVGWWSRYPRESHRRNAELEKLAVNPGYHGLGIGRQIAEVLIEDARRADIDLLTLDVRSDTVHAQQLYAALGFEVYGVLRDAAVFPYGRFDKVMMVKDLRTEAR
jgi:ribosomal protein S18 acetylase RimI-like enzyme